jgi:glycerophosphoryl diester phosphodiesterase
MKSFLLALGISTSLLHAVASTNPDGYATLSSYRYTGQATIGQLINGKYEQVKVVSGQEYFVWKKNSLQLTARGRQELEKRNALTVRLSFRRNGAAEEKSFTIVADRFNKNPVIAHRGAWKKSATPENSIASLEHAFRLNCAGTEFDVHMTKDDSLVVNHDPDFYGKPIEDYTYAELSATRLPNGEILPTLRSFLQAGLQQYGTQLIVEIKPTSKGPERAKHRATEVVKMVHELGAQAWVNYISFDYTILLRVQELDPAAHLQYLNGEKSPEELSRDGMPGLDYHHGVFRKHPDWIQSAKAHNMVLNVWTVNSEEDLRYFLGQKFPMITTNEPELLFELIKASSSASR